MLTLNERAILRDELFIKLMDAKILITYITGVISIVRKNNLIKFLNNNDELRFKYYLYISEFRSEEEAIYCLRYHDDYEHHRCPVCNNLTNFFYYPQSQRQGYRILCGNNNCLKVCTRSELANQKRKDTCEAKYGPGIDNPMKSLTVQAKAIATNLAKRNVPYSTQDPAVQQKYRDTCEATYGPGIINTFQVEEFKQKAKDTKLKNHGDPNYNNRKKAVETCKNTYGPGITNPKQVHEIKEKAVITYMQNHCLLDPVTIEKCQSLLNIIKEGLTLIEIYADDEYFKQFIELLYIKENRLLHLIEIADIFGFKSGQPIHTKIKRLNLTKYFNIQDSLLELQIRDFLLNNDLNFERRNKNILPLNQETGGHPEIDFFLNDYNLCFEIDDMGGHNIIQKEQFYHYTKSKHCLEQGKRLIHLWEWELNDTYWPKISQWILHILNQNKVQFSLSDCTIQYITKEEQIPFLNQYSITSYQATDMCIGFYHNNELIQIIYFNLIESYLIMNICVKFGYNIVNGTKEFIKSYIQTNKIPYIFSYIDLSKFTGKTFEDMGFELLQYQEPNIISEKNDETAKIKKLYNCGYNVYIFKEIS